MIKLVVLTSLFVVVRGRPNASIDTQNVISVPPNCPTGQIYIDGRCREVWKRSQHNPYNVITVPPNCPIGQQWINGQCRDVWTQGVNPKNTATVPPNCLNGQEFTNGKCRDVWRQNLIDSTNVVSIPPNCPDGQQYIDAACREVWIKQNEVDSGLEYSNLKSLLNSWFEALMSKRFGRAADEAKAKIQNRNIISVPNHCPNGFLPDAHGICRPIFDS